MDIKAEIPFDEVLSQGNNKSSSNEIDSLRFSEDYVPFARKNSKSHEY